MAQIIGDQLLVGRLRLPIDRVTHVTLGQGNGPARDGDLPGVTDPSATESSHRKAIMSPHRSVLFFAVGLIAGTSATGAMMAQAAGSAPVASSSTTCKPSPTPKPTPTPKVTPKPTPAPSPAPVPPGTPGPKPAGVHGFATVAGSTTGGGAGPVVTVTSLAALRTEAARSGAEVIRVSGTYTGSGDVVVASNKTIVGVGSTAGLVGAGLKLKGVSNVIIQNLTISLVTAASGTGDAIHVESSNHVWIDHNTLSSDVSHGKDYYDGLIYLTHAADYITVSWNYLHDHYKVSLVGHSDSNAKEDTGHLHVTYDHNYFKNINSRTPSLRFGTGHVYDNYFVGGDTGVHSRMGAQMLVQDNVFSGVSIPIETTGDSKQDGYVNQSGNVFGSGVNKITQTGTFTSAPYAVSLDAASVVPGLVQAGAGAGHL